MDDEITRLLRRAETGDGAAMAAVFDTLYPQLRQLAASRLRGNQGTLTPTALVSEFYLRFSSASPMSLASRRHFFAAAAKAMRWIVVDQARRRSAGKRGDGKSPITLSERISAAGQDEEVLALHEAMEALDEISPRRREVVEMRYFVGLEFAEVAELLGISERTAKREWAQARAFLHAVLQQAD